MSDTDGSVCVDLSVIVCTMTDRCQTHDSVCGFVCLLRYNDWPVSDTDGSVCVDLSVIFSTMTDRCRTQIAVCVWIRLSSSVQ